MPALNWNTRITLSLTFDATAAWMVDLFDWHIRWRGDSQN